MFSRLTKRKRSRQKTSNYGLFQFVDPGSLVYDEEINRYKPTPCITLPDAHDYNFETYSLGVEAATNYIREKYGECSNW